MILYYLDASAWIKRYCAEEGTGRVAELFAAGAPIACAALGLVEVLSTLARKGKAGDLPMWLSAGDWSQSRMGFSTVVASEQGIFTPA